MALDKTYVRLGPGTPGGGSDECGGTILQPEMAYDDLDREIWQAPLSAQGMEVVMTTMRPLCPEADGRWSCPQCLASLRWAVGLRMHRLRGRSEPLLQ